MSSSIAYPDRLEQIRQRAAQVNAWAHLHWRANALEHSARTPGLRPTLSSDGQPLLTLLSVEDVARRRSIELSLSGIAIAPDTVPRGRVLAFDPQQSLSDGAAAAESQGFFDDDNVPPWDSWLIFVEDTPRSPEHWSEFDSYLLCWIPDSLVELVARAVEVNPEQCLRWANELRTPFLDQVARAGGRLPGV